MDERNKLDRGINADGKLIMINGTGVITDASSLSQGSSSSIWRYTEWGKKELSGNTSTGGDR